MTRPTNIGPTRPRISSLGVNKTTLGDLFDVDLTGIADGDVIIWDASSETWIVGAQTGGTSDGEFPRPLMAYDVGDDHWYVVVDGDGTAVMVTG